MELANIIFAALISLLTLSALGLAMRAWGQGESRRQIALGWVIFAAAGVIQVGNLLTGYNSWISIATTIAMGVGLWMVRGMLRRA